jgi:hypothetical protein
MSENREEVFLLYIFLYTFSVFYVETKIYYVIFVVRYEQKNA